MLSLSMQVRKERLDKNSAEGQSMRYPFCKSGRATTYSTHIFELAVKQKAQIMFRQSSKSFSRASNSSENSFRHKLIKNDTFSSTSDELALDRWTSYPSKTNCFFS